MTQTTDPSSMRTFTIIWMGQLVSTIGSYMTEFALSIWAWQLTGSATALALVSFFSQLPRISIALFAGVIVDRCNRKYLMILGDSIAVLSTIAIGLLYFTHNLQIWHLYLTGAVNSCFGQLQQLAYSTSITLLVPQHQYTRASSMGSMVHYGSTIFSPALAGSLYPVIGLVGILLIDLLTFAVAIASLLFVHIPQPPITPVNSTPEKIGQQLTFGFRYILTKPGLSALLIISSLFWFAHDLGGAVYEPMILARTGGNAQVLGSVASAAGVGGVTGALIVSTWGGFQRRIKGMLLGFIGAGLSKTVFGLGRVPSIWIPAQFCSSLNFPLLGSSETGIWLAKVAPELQGRVFAAQSLILQIVSASATLIAGPIADYLLEPAMMPGGHLVPIFGGVFGTGSGAGIAILYVTASICMLLIGAGGFTFPTLRNLEDIVPDHEVVSAN